MHQSIPVDRIKASQDSLLDKENASSQQSSFCYVINSGSDSHMPDHPIIRSESMFDYEDELANIDEYFLSEFKDDNVAKKFF